MNVVQNETTDNTMYFDVDELKSKLKSGSKFRRKMVGSDREHILSAEGARNRSVTGCANPINGIEIGVPAKYSAGGAEDGCLIQRNTSTP